MDIEFTDQIDVNCVHSNATDLMVVNAARVSTQGVDAPCNTEESVGLINFLMSNRHGTPFEHNSFTFFVDAPIFVYREFHRHRVGWSYNEESGRYTELRGKFYIPNAERNLVQTGKPGHYIFSPGTDDQYLLMRNSLQVACRSSYKHYQFMLEAGIAKEVARMCLPVAIYSSMYATCNARSLMSFLSLRQQRDQLGFQGDAWDPNDWITLKDIAWDNAGTGAMFPSKPMKEINIVADKLEEAFAEAMPLTHAAFIKNGCVAP